MPTNTPRLNLMQPVGPDPPSQLRVAITNNATTTDNAAIWLSGAVGARPAAGAVAVGTFYKGTDTGLLYHSDGTTWTVVMLAGPWTAFMLPTGFTNTGGFSAAPRWSQVGNRILLDGVIKSTTSFTSTAALSGPPAVPSNISIPTLLIGTSTGVTVGILDPTGIQISVFTAINQQVSLAGMSYPLD